MSRPRASRVIRVPTGCRRWFDRSRGGRARRRRARRCQSGTGIVPFTPPRHCDRASSRSPEVGARSRRSSRWRDARGRDDKTAQCCAKTWAASSRSRRATARFASAGAATREMVLVGTESLELPGAVLEVVVSIGVPAEGGIIASAWSANLVVDEHCW